MNLTNEEIRKRFIFDLKIGLFKMYKEKFIFFRNNDSNDLQKVLKIIRSCENFRPYYSDNINKHANKNSILILHIYGNNEITYNITESLDKSFYTFFIDPPEYIKYYQLS